MEARHDDGNLEAAELDAEYRGKLNRDLVRALRKVMNIVRNIVTNESELVQHKGLNFEKLKGKRSHQHSLRLNDQFRLIVEIEKREGANNNKCVVKAIEDYH